jgi:hypothetical protein
MSGEFESRGKREEGFFGFEVEVEEASTKLAVVD